MYVNNNVRETYTNNMIMRYDNHVDIIPKTIACILYLYIYIYICICISDMDDAQ